MSPKFPKYIPLILNEGEVQWAKKDKFGNELMEVWRALGTYILLRNSKYLSHTYENFQTCSIKVFLLFLKHCKLLILKTLESTSAL